MNFASCKYEGDTLIIDVEGQELIFAYDKLDELTDLLNDANIGEMITTNGIKIHIDSSHKNYFMIISFIGDDIKSSRVDFDDVIENPDEINILHEGLIPVFRRIRGKIKRGYKVTSGPRKGRIVANAATAFAPMKPVASRYKIGISARRKKFIRAFKSKLTRMKPMSVRLRMLNQ